MSILLFSFKFSIERAPFTKSSKFPLKRAKRIEKDVILTGLVSETDLINLYSSAEIYVFPSLYEGFGLPPLESMACQTPVAASYISSIPEVCGKGNAVFFNPHDYKDMAIKINALLKDKNLREELIQNGFKWVKNFSWDKMADETLKIYKECLHS